MEFTAFIVLYYKGFVNYGSHIAKKTVGFGFTVGGKDEVAEKIVDLYVMSEIFEFVHTDHTPFVVMSILYKNRCTKIVTVISNFLL